MPASKQWKKILYENQGLPDNYTDKTFLKDLRKNIEHREVSLLEAVTGASYFVQELCAVVAFVLVYVYLYNEWVETQTVLLYTCGTSVIGFLFYINAFDRSELKETLGHIRTLLIFYVFGKFFSPVLHTLTDTISTDTIYTTTSFMMLIHLIFFDYGVPAAIVSNSLSLNAVVFASICLASRLSSAHQALALIIVAIECFLLFPLLRNKYRKSAIFSFLLISSVTFTLFTVSKIITVLFVCTLFFILIVCPLLFRRYQKYKDNIYGPWDEAVVDNADNINDLVSF